MKQVAILGASGYTGAELVRILHGHPGMQIAALAANSKAGQSMASVYPHLRHMDLPALQRIEDVDFSGIDLVFCALPHGLTHGFAAQMPSHLRMVDLSADFRLRDAAAYKKWYGLDHTAMQIQPQVAYGLPEVYRDTIRQARITANTGCYVATSLLPLIPALRAGILASEGIVIDAKSGTSGAGRSPCEAMLFCEVNESLRPYGVAHHRHMGELDQELSLAAGGDTRVTFTPHLLPIQRGMMATIYASGQAEAVHEALVSAYAGEAFVTVLPLGEVPAIAHVRGSNQCHIGVVADRVPGRVIMVSVLDNLMKGASGQAVQNANLMLDLPETAGLLGGAIFP